MEILRLNSVDGFVLFDLAGAPGTGIARRARKVLRSSAASLARSTPYSFASFEVRACGASVGVNAEEPSDELLNGLTEELLPLVTEGRLAIDPGVGFSADELQPLIDADSRPATVLDDEADLTARGALEAAKAFGNLARVAIVGDTPAADRLRSIVVDAGIATDQSGGLTTTADALFVAGKAGLIDHDVAATITARLVVPLTPLPVTAKAFAVLNRAKIIYLPDFLTLAGPLLAGRDPAGGDPVERVAAVSALTVDHPRGPWWAGVERAEAFMHTWRDQIPFGRPLN